MRMSLLALLVVVVLGRGEEGKESVNLAELVAHHTAWQKKLGDATRLRNRVAFTKLKEEYDDETRKKFPEGCLVTVTGKVWQVRVTVFETKATPEDFKRYGSHEIVLSFFDKDHPAPRAGSFRLARRVPGLEVRCRTWDKKLAARLKQEDAVTLQGTLTGGWDPVRGYILTGSEEASTKK